MKKGKQKSVGGRVRTNKIGKLSVLVGALIASGVLSSVLLPEAAFALPPLPLPCGGCGTLPGTAIPITFQQAGHVVLSNANSTNLTIKQTTPTAILNWQSFNIDQKYSVNFNQYYSDGITPNNNASTLNRIWGGDPSTIAGSLTANGQVYLINQNGIIFASGAQ